MSPFTLLKKLWTDVDVPIINLTIQLNHNNILFQKVEKQHHLSTNDDWKHNVKNRVQVKVIGDFV